VLGGLLIAQALHLLPQMPAGFGVTRFTLAGAVLLGLGAYVNGACVFGAIARLGSGEWRYVFTPIGFYVGCVTVGGLFSPPAAEAFAYGSPVLQVSMWAAVPLVALMLFRVLRPVVGVSTDNERFPLVQRLHACVTQRIWSPHAATAVIGVAFVLILLLIGGTWAYTDVLAELAHGMAESLIARSALVVALFVGAVVGGYTAGRFRSTPITITKVATCFAGGALMGWGSLLIPGSNDGLILVGMPLLLPHAWIAFATMAASIAAAMLLRRSIGRLFEESFQKNER
jgi:toxin CptA